jgi:hypothetical protein
MIDVGTPGFSIDITACEIKIDGQTLSAAMESMEPSIKQEEELTWLHGLQEPQERSAGQRSYECQAVMPTRQFLLLVEALAAGNFDDFQNLELSMTIHGRPRNDDKMYEFQLNKFRFLDHGFNLDKSASKNKMRCSYLSYSSAVIDDPA